MINYNKESNQTENTKRTPVWMSSATRHLRKPVRKKTANSYNQQRPGTNNDECSVGA